GRIHDARLNNAIHQRGVATGKFRIEEVKQFVLDDVPAQAGAGLQAPFVRVEVGVRIVRDEVLVTVKPVTRPMQIVSSTACHGVHHAAAGTAVLGRYVGRYHLEFLHGVLRDLRGNACAAVVLDVVLLGGIVAIQKKVIAVRHAAKRQQPEVSVVAYARRQQYEGVDTPAVDGQIQD